MKTSIFISTILIGSLASAANDSSMYQCTSTMINGQRNTTQTMFLSVSETAATADILNELWDNNLIGGERNTRYKPRSSARYIKFGRNLVVEESLAYGGRPLNDGSFGGWARVEGEFEGGFSQYKFICKKHL